MGDGLHLPRQRKPDHHPAGASISSLLGIAVFGLYILSRFQGQLRRIQAHGTGTLRRSGSEQVQRFERSLKTISSISATTDQSGSTRMSLITPRGCGWSGMTNGRRSSGFRLATRRRSFGRTMQHGSGHTRVTEKIIFRMAKKQCD